MKVLFTGGGTGGHLFPIIAVVREMRRLSPDHNVKLSYIGPSDRTGAFLLNQEGVKVYKIAEGKIRRYFSFRNIVDIIFNIPLGFLQSFFILMFHRPNIIFSKGGTGSAVVLSCAHLLRIPIFIHESDTVPGLSNRTAYKWAKKVFISFPKTAYFNLQKTLVTGNPILKEIMEGSLDNAKEIFNLTFEKPIILFLGGSQGAQPLNDFILSVLPQLLQKYEVIHVSGRKNYQQVYEESKGVLTPELERYYHLWQFLDEIPLKHAFKAANFVVSRAGSGSIFEIAACGLPSILVPLPGSAQDHQSKNAYEYALHGATFVMEQENLTPNFFMEKLNYLFSHPDEMEAMKIAALDFSRPLAAKAIAREILEYLG